MQPARDLRAFRNYHGYPVPLRPTPPDAAMQVERVRMLREELEELEKAMICGDVAAIVHEATDLAYVAFGTIVGAGCGPAIEDAWQRIHEANMSKTPPATPDGKPGKPEGWEPADVTDLVEWLT